MCKPSFKLHHAQRSAKLQAYDVEWVLLMFRPLFCTGKIKIQDILACSFLDDLLEVHYESFIHSFIHSVSQSVSQSFSQLSVSLISNI